MPHLLGAQPGIFDQTQHSFWVQQFRVVPAVDVGALRRALGQICALDEPGDQGVRVVVAIGASLLGTLDPDGVPAGTRPFTGINGLDGHDVPTTQDDLLVWIAGSSPSSCSASAQAVGLLLSETAMLTDETQGYTHLDGRDLTGFIDGTENPSQLEAPRVAAVASGPGAGASHVIAMKWRHRLVEFSELATHEQEQVVGPTQPDSIELDPLPERSHVERVVITDEHGDEREMFRRSFSFGTPSDGGLFFLGFAADPSIAGDMLDRMFGLADGKRDRLIDFSEAQTCAFYVAPGTDRLLALCR